MTLRAAEVSCMVCAATGSTSAFQEPTPLRRCVNCGFVFTAETGAANGSYDAEYFSGGGYRSYFARTPQWRYEARRRLRWLLATAHPGRLLEIGCAGGFFVEAALRARIDALGVEASEVAAAYARERLGVSVVIGRFEDLEVPERFDAVCAFHVLEHVEDPIGFLAKARGLMAPGGCLALEVPNIESSAARAHTTRWPGLQPEYHRWHFAPLTLTRLVGSCGFAVRRCDTIYAAHYRRPGHRLIRAAGRRPSQTEHPLLGDHIRLLARVIP